MDDGPLAFDVALWIRAAERIPVPAGGIMPGPLLIDPAPPSTTDAPQDLAEGWRNWWRQLTQTTLPSDGRPTRREVAAVMDLEPPHAAGLAAWPGLQEVIARRFSEASAWHHARSRPARRTTESGMRQDYQAIRQAIRSSGRDRDPFVLDLVVLPVRDGEIRRVGDGRYLVSEELYLSPDWPRHLRELIAVAPQQPV